MPLIDGTLPPQPTIKQNQPRLNAPWAVFKSLANMDGCVHHKYCQIHQTTKKKKRKLLTKKEQPQLICTDLESMPSIPGAIFIQGDLREPQTQTKLRSALASNEADVILSDMSPPTTGEKETNHLRIMQLAEQAFDLAQALLRNGGTFVCKIFSGSEENEFRSLLKTHFAKVRAVRPAATRKVSPEVYYVAQGFVPPHLKASDQPEDVNKTVHLVNEMT